jgi:hypothetical protein
MPFRRPGPSMVGPSVWQSLTNHFTGASLTLDGSVLELGPRLGPRRSGPAFIHLQDGCGARASARLGPKPFLHLEGVLHTRVTSILACFRTLRSDLGAPRSVMTSCGADVGTMRERLRRPNLLFQKSAHHLSAGCSKRRLARRSGVGFSSPVTPMEKLCA